MPRLLSVCAPVSIATRRASAGEGNGGLPACSFFTSTAIATSEVTDLGSWPVSSNRLPQQLHLCVRDRLARFRTPDNLRSLTGSGVLGAASR
jgi:hypothetical protein